jgi:hypothetical protein
MVIIYISPLTIVTMILYLGLCVLRIKMVISLNNVNDMIFEMVMICVLFQVLNTHTLPSRASALNSPTPFYTHCPSIYT